ncbi:response regulator [Tanticharoenia sakaeratensis]|uniref:Two component response regulator n=1 Tax=Tanticharoenia sakaeratensis NBRC 103193 TaxID=1231623 RepID=A0A0D6MK33_9PROT|nr:response regulator [Tanticharoenia sakaeratensis]GAN53831.1 two component response regulator [Tanticharoenia sakaeratensis NBRC 103193]GBQ25024.1 response regulator [Tanticharoenia sakaeratensis NBRC 103193]
MPLTTEFHAPLQTVLVVEDQAFLRFMTMDMIEDWGFATVGAATSAEALALLESRPDISLVFSDVDMPGSMDGMAMAAHLGRARRAVSVILTSGKMPDRGVELPARSAFLPKPYLVEDVARLLRQMCPGNSLPA